jgi:hypothetical protein
MKRAIHIVCVWVVVGLASGNIAYADGLWQITTVDSVGNVGEWTSIALDPDDNPHISYYDESNTAPKYAHFSSGAWSTERVDDSGWSTSIAIDTAGIPYISYLYFTGNEYLRMAYKSGASWNIAELDGPNAGWSSSVKLDNSGHPRMSYVDSTNVSIRYAAYNGSTWTTELVDTAGNTGSSNQSSLALDTENNPHISYYDRDRKDLRYAWKEQGVWTTEIVDSAGIAGRGSSIAVDAAGNIHIAYKGSGDLKYAFYDGVTWSTEVVDRSLDTWVSLALDAEGNPHISYSDYDDDGYVLRYAYNNGTDWLLL